MILLAAAAFAICLAGCGPSDAVEVEIDVNQPALQVTTMQPSGCPSAEYTGECDAACAGAIEYVNRIRRAARPPLQCAAAAIGPPDQFHIGHVGRAARSHAAYMTRAIVANDGCEGSSGDIEFPWCQGFLGYRNDDRIAAQFSAECTLPPNPRDRFFKPNGMWHGYEAMFETFESSLGVAAPAPNLTASSLVQAALDNPYTRQIFFTDGDGFHAPRFTYAYHQRGLQIRNARYHVLVPVLPFVDNPGPDGDWFPLEDSWDDYKQRDSFFGPWPDDIDDTSWERPATTWPPNGTSIKRIANMCLFQPSLPGAFGCTTGPALSVHSASWLPYNSDSQAMQLDVLDTTNGAVVPGRKLSWLTDAAAQIKRGSYYVIPDAPLVGGRVYQVRARGMDTGDHCGCATDANGWTPPWCWSRGTTTCSINHEFTFSFVAAN